MISKSKRVSNADSTISSAVSRVEVLLIVLYLSCLLILDKFTVPRVSSFGGEGKWLEIVVDSSHFHIQQKNQSNNHLLNQTFEMGRFVVVCGVFLSCLSFSFS